MKWGRGKSADAQEKRYPPYVLTDEERKRWDLAEGIARELFGDVDEANVWMATRSIYRADIPTENP